MDHGQKLSPVVILKRYLDREDGSRTANAAPDLSRSCSLDETTDADWYETAPIDEVRNLLSKENIDWASEFETMRRELGLGKAAMGPRSVAINDNEGRTRKLYKEVGTVRNLLARSRRNGAVFMYPLMFFGFLFLFLQYNVNSKKVMDLMLNIDGSVYLASDQIAEQVADAEESIRRALEVYNEDASAKLNRIEGKLDLALVAGVLESASADGLVEADVVGLDGNRSVSIGEFSPFVATWDPDIESLVGNQTFGSGPLSVTAPWLTEVNYDAAILQENADRNRVFLGNFWEHFSSAHKSRATGLMSDLRLE